MHSSMPDKGAFHRPVETRGESLKKSGQDPKERRYLSRGKVNRCYLRLTLQDRKRNHFHLPSASQQCPHLRVSRLLRSKRLPALLEVFNLFGGARPSENFIAVWISPEAFDNLTMLLFKAHEVLAKGSVGLGIGGGDIWR